MSDLRSSLLDLARVLIGPGPQIVRMDSAPEVRTDCGPAGCGPANLGGNGNWMGTPGSWATMEPGLTMWDIDRLCVDQLMWRIVVRIIDDAMNPSGRPVLSGDLINGESSEIITYLDVRGFWEAARQAQIYARMYGGGGVVIFADDGKRNDAELDIENLKTIKGFYALPKWYLTPLDAGSGRVEAGWYGQRVGRPEMYLVTPQGGDGSPAAPPNSAGSAPIVDSETLRDSISAGGNRFHRSRIIPWMFRDDMDLRQARRFNNWNGWGPGVVEACLAPYLNRKMGALRLADILNSAVMNVLKMPGVMNAMSTPAGGSPLRNALDWVKACLAYTGDGLPMIAIDGASELKAEGHNLSGIDKLVAEQRRFLLDTIEYPEVVIFGSGGANGLSGDSNEGQWRNYYGTVKSLQESWVWRAGSFGGGVRQGILLAMAAKDGPMEGVMDQTVQASWPSLWVDTDKARAETRLKDAQARASDALVLGLKGQTLARMDPTVQKAYPSLDVDDGPLPLDETQVGAPLPAQDAEQAKAAATPGAANTAVAEESSLPEGTVPTEDAVPAIPLVLPEDIATEKEIASALKMTRPSFRRWIDTTTVTTYPTPRGTRGGARYSLGEVLKAWQAGAVARVDAIRKPAFQAPGSDLQIRSLVLDSDD